MPAEGRESDRDAAHKRGRKVRLRTLNDIDRRTRAARAALELRDGMISDLGGTDAVTTMKRAIVDSAATLGAMLEDMAASYLAGEGADCALYATLANSQRRLLSELGLERRARDLAPDLRSYVASKAQNAA